MSGTALTNTATGKPDVDGLPLDLGQLAWRDPQRPRFHFVSPGGWLNDPNGLCRWAGRYHLFYQYNPAAAVHHRIHWGHASSTDLVHWRDEPVALVPSDGPDVDGCWSGVVVDDGGVPTMVYSGRKDGREAGCVATGSPDLVRWRKHPTNPVLAGPPPGLDVTAFRDHCVWREGTLWHQLVGSGQRGVGGAALHYTSPDLRSWTYVGPMLVGDAATTEPIWTAEMWECVDLFDLDGTSVLAFSVWDDGETLYPAYVTGRREGGRLVAGPARLLDLGLRHFYAPQSLLDDDGRRIMFGWMQEAREDAAAVAAGWSGVMSLPRVVRLDAGGELAFAPAAEVAALRTTRLHGGPAVLGAATAVQTVDGDQLDLVAEVRLPAGTRVELAVRATADGAEQSVVVLDRAPGAAGARLTLDRSSSSLDPGVDTVALGGDVPVGPDDRVALRVLVDHSALEIFANGRALSARVYPTRPDAVGVWLGGWSAPGVAGRPVPAMDRLDVWRMADLWTGPRPLWPDAQS
ncbi:glycoside hydrolase family 32 protein [Pengzhenrongella phosphoraccumulans]|uniref:glycoside hydrolase family 32 protein n=1 Tax=Pengzhenrongella phosphoraccumulans TaxID=3114394 RepID=UPI00388F484F